MKKEILIMLLSTSFIGLTGCSSIMGTDFSCNKINGVQGCASLSQINQAIKDGTISTEEPVLQIGNDSENSTINNAPYLNEKITGYSAQFPNIGAPIRTGDKVQKITIFPYQDDAGFYHEPSNMYVVLKQSDWIKYTRKQVKKMENL